MSHCDLNNDQPQYLCGKLDAINIVIHTNASFCWQLKKILSYSFKNENREMRCPDEYCQTD